jgi:hypothetical protein
MSRSTRQADELYDHVAAGGSVWTIRDAGGFPAPVGSDGVRAQPFWSSHAEASAVVRGVAAYAHFEIVEIASQAFCERWLPGLARDGIGVGLNWSGPRATGFDVSAHDVSANIAARRSRR